MKKIFPILVIIITGLSCKKQKETSLSELSFGKAYGFCAGDCARFFKLEGDSIYPDISARYTGQGSINFSSSALANDKYLLAKELKDNFPDYLFGRAGQTFGCPDCADQGGIHVETRINGEVQAWHFDTNLTKLPAEIRPYAERILAILSQL